MKWIVKKIKNYVGELRFERSLKVVKEGKEGGEVITGTNTKELSLVSNSTKT